MFYICGYGMEKTLIFMIYKNSDGFINCDFSVILCPFQTSYTTCCLCTYRASSSESTLMHPATFLVQTLRRVSFGSFSDLNQSLSDQFYFNYVISNCYKYWINTLLLDILTLNFSTDKIYLLCCVRNSSESDQVYLMR